MNSPPSAPQKRVRRKRPKALWEVLRGSNRMRAKYKWYTPEDVEELDDVEFLKFLYVKYTFPSSQPQTHEEWVYFSLMSNAIDGRLKVL